MQLLSGFYKGVAACSLKCTFELVSDTARDEGNSGVRPELDTVLVPGRVFRAGGSGCIGYACFIVKREDGEEIWRTWWLLTRALISRFIFPRYFFEFFAFVAIVLIDIECVLYFLLELVRG